MDPFEKAFIQFDKQEKELAEIRKSHNNIIERLKNMEMEVEHLKLESKK